jgi:hypothetical protein
VRRANIPSGAALTINNHRADHSYMKTRSMFVLTAAAALLAVTLAGCQAMDQAYQQGQAYNAQQCGQVYGLQPGTDAYVQCVAQGPRAYADARAAAAAANPAPPPGMAVLPIPVIGIPVVTPPAKNNACSAPKSSPLGACAGCSVSCGAQSAACTPGQEVPGGSTICLTQASCTCQ